MATTWKPYDADIPEGHAFAESRLCFREDLLLRKYGFAVRSRPKRGPVLWEKGGKTYTQAEAMVEVKKRQAELLQTKAV